MEALIMMIILGLISSFFNKKEAPKKKRPAMPPFNNPPAAPSAEQTNRPKSLEDFANEIFGQLNDKTKAAPPVQAPVEVVPAAPPVVQERTSRPPLEERPLVKKLKQESIQVVPKNQQQVMQAVVMAEVLGKPKAKR